MHNIIIPISNKKEKSSLLTENNRLSQLLENLPVMLFAANQDNDICIWNNECVRLSGYEKHEMIGKNIDHILEILFGETAPANIRSELSDAKNAYKEMHLPFLNKFSKTKTISWTNITTSIDIPEFSICLSGNDITAIKEQEDNKNKLIKELESSRDTIVSDAFKAIDLNNKLFESEERLRQSNLTKDKFFSIIAHDLRSPIHSFKNLVEILVRDFDKIEKEEVGELLSAMETSTKQLSSLLDNLLQWARSQTSQIQLNQEDLYLDQLVSNIISLIETQAQNKNISIHTDFNHKSVAFADENMIYTVVRNFMSNAIKFTPHGGTITIATKETAKEIQTSVIDSGVGIKKENLENLFRLDVYHSTHGTDQEKGNGLGLILCDEFIRKNNGHIFVDSIEGEGSTFSFTVPKGQAHDIIHEQSAEGIVEYKEEPSDIFEFTARNTDLESLKYVYMNLIDNFSPIYEKMKDVPLIGEITDFADDMHEIAEQNEIDSIASYAADLSKYSKELDIINMSVKLEEYPEVLEQFHSYINKLQTNG